MVNTVEQNKNRYLACDDKRAEHAQKVQDMIDWKTIYMQILINYS
jgi:hypothetical protein